MNKYAFTEIEAMRKIAEALTGLEVDEIRRVLQWVNAKYSYEEMVSLALKPDQRNISNQDHEPPEKSHSPGQLFASVSPSTDSEKALVIGYWLQYHQGVEEFESAKVNSNLKQLGHQISNVTRAFTHLQSRDPQLAIQTKKSGRTQQARKKYQITDAGKRYVEDMLRKKT